MGETTAEVNGATLAYELAGEGSPVVLVHPGLWDRRVWDDQFVVFAMEHLVLRYDLRGYGKSSRPEPGQSYSHLDDLAALLDVVEIDRAAVVGCSMGGRIALDFALAYPDRVTGLVLVTPGLSGFEPTEEDDSWWDERMGPVREAVDAGQLDWAEDMRLAIWAPLGTDDEAGRRIRQIAFDNLHELTMDESGERELDPPAAGRLGEVRVPTLVLPADNDPPYMQRVCRQIAAGIPGAELVEIPNTDHVISVRSPRDFNRVVLPFLAELARAEL